MGTICQGLCLAVYMNFSYLILPKSYEKGTMMCSGCGLGCGWFGAQIQMVIHPSSSPEFPAKEHIHQRISIFQSVRAVKERLRIWISRRRLGTAELKCGSGLNLSVAKIIVGKMYTKISGI